jgi:hypothetical protein
MNLDQYLRRVLDALEGIHSHLEQLRILAEHELGVRLEHSKQGGGPYCRSSRPARSKKLHEGRGSNACAWIRNPSP